MFAALGTSLGLNGKRYGKSSRVLASGTTRDCHCDPASQDCRFWNCFCIQVSKLFFGKLLSRWLVMASADNDTFIVQIWSWELGGIWDLSLQNGSVSVSRDEFDFFFWCQLHCRTKDMSFSPSRYLVCFTEEGRLHRPLGRPADYIGYGSKPTGISRNTGIASVWNCREKIRAIERGQSLIGKYAAPELGDVKSEPREKQTGKNLQLHNVSRSKRTKRRTLWIFWSSRFVWIWCMIFKDLTHSNAPTWGAVGTAVVRFPERLQKKQDSVYHRASLLRYRFQLNEAVHLCNLLYLQDYQFGVFLFFGTEFNFQIFHFNAIFNILQIFSFDL